MHDIITLFVISVLISKVFGGATHGFLFKDSYVTYSAFQRYPPSGVARKFSRGGARISKSKNLYKKKKCFTSDAK